MSVFSRARLILRVKSNTALDAMEQPTQMFDYAVEAQRDLVRKVNLGLVDVTTSRLRLERQAAKLRARIPALDEQAKRALEADREDLARSVLERKKAALDEIAAIENASASLDEEERQLATAARHLSARIEQFATRRTIATARHEAAAARVRVGEAVTGIGGDLADLTAAIHRAEERTERLASRANAIDTLVNDGSLEISFSPDRVEAEIQAIAAKHAVDEDLQRLRDSLQTTTPAPAESPAGDQVPAEPAATT